MHSGVKCDGRMVGDERSRRRVLRCYRQHSHPTAIPRELRRSAKPGGVATCPGTGKSQDEIASFVAETTSHLDGQDHQTTTRAANELRVFALLGAARFRERDTVYGSGSGAGAAVPTDGADDRAVDGYLRTLETR